MLVSDKKRVEPEMKKLFLLWKQIISMLIKRHFIQNYFRK